MTDSAPSSFGLVLALNCGSSTFKASLLDPVTGARRLTAYAQIGDGRLQLRRGEVAQESTVVGDGLASLVEALMGSLSADERGSLSAVAHRLVHGGAVLRDHSLIDAAVRHLLDGAAQLAPLHVPSALAALDTARKALPSVPHVATLDTAFHRRLPEVAFRYAVPKEWFADHGVRRYGFHGLSHQSVTEQAAARLGRPVEELRLVTLHLGNGCSAAAVRGGVSVDTTMGFTPLEGLVMGTRSGDVDPGVLGYVSARTGLGIADLLEMLNHESGLLSLSGLSNDVRELTRAAEDGSAAAALALDVYCYRVAKAVAAMTVPLGGLDALVFTGGVGEHSARVRADVVRMLGHLGLAICQTRNGSGGDKVDGRLSPDGEPSVWAIPTDEELVMARAAVSLASR